MNRSSTVSSFARHSKFLRMVDFKATRPFCRPISFDIGSSLCGGPHLFLDVGELHFVDISSVQYRLLISVQFISAIIDLSECFKRFVHMRADVFLKPMGISLEAFMHFPRPVGFQRTVARYYPFSI